MTALNQAIEQSQKLAADAAELSQHLSTIQVPSEPAMLHAGIDPFIFSFTVFVLACFIGYYVVWKVTPALHTPLMSVTNAISGIIVVGALIAAGATYAVESSTPWIGFFAIILASINIFGGFVVTHRMLQMFKKK